ncbi:single-stranded DNA-binding protein [Oculatella sp. FACHB-28]|uniref:single-stranded DNA-binding protein n=1 Tax=Cyanophyceae TaxID=3028117 RepID=UPI00168250FE|nr:MULTISPECIES: single-stranded DNA-binding protein [Cyanophyceae]MBD1866376.1 single-stranded DNA-binding protein [Cyanobacteria bacterium FACHB-471]MBD1998514.1 single-stranded DNA-binding protein [Leptolyngbya sp. FACHB-541]MBD2059582.1 single-stranded DNA-binding protein [Oculatella sp. FACHB-28]MBD2071387.1 single-stranded DNA-binding protein [Leptolyngbya sp. FACHB-671]
MNSCILMAEIIQEPQLRYTSDNQTPITEMIVQFPGIRDDDPLATMKVVGWGNLAQEIQERFHEGDRVIIEGRLSMNTIDRPEGFKEKRAELTAQKIHSVSGDVVASAVSNPATAAAPAPTSAPASAPRSQAPAKTASRSATRSAAPETSKSAAYSAPAETADYDDIPF